MTTCGTFWTIVLIVLAEQALAAGGIEFSQVGGELRAVMRTITGKEGEEL